MTDNDDTWTDTTRLTPLEKKVQSETRVHFELNQVNGEGSPRSIPLTEQAVTVGRSPDADIQVPCPTLSRRHIEIRRQADECFVKDLQSSNGFFLNGVKVHSAVLRNGDTIQLGNVIFTFHEGIQ